MADVKQEATAGAATTCPRMKGICGSVLDAIGGTPLIRLNHIAEHLDCEILVKAEFLNAGGSV